MSFELTYEFYPATFDEYANLDPVEWTYEISDDDLEEFLIHEFTPKEFAELLYDSGYLFNDGVEDAPWDYWSDIFGATFNSVEEVRDYISKMNSMSDVLYKFDLSEQEFEDVIWNDDKLYEDIKDFFRERADEDFDSNYDPLDGHYDFEDNSLYYQYKEGPEYWRK